MSAVVPMPGMSLIFPRPSRVPIDLKPSFLHHTVPLFFFPTLDMVPRLV